MSTLNPSQLVAYEFRPGGPPQERKGRMVTSLEGIEAKPLSWFSTHFQELLLDQIAAGEVDFVVQTGRRLTAIEVTSGRAPQAHAGTAAFAAAFRPQRTLLVGGDGIALEEFLMQPVSHWVDA